MKQQPQSLRIWQTPHGSVWASIDVHVGRTTKRIKGPEANDPETAKEMVMTLYETLRSVSR